MPSRWYILSHTQVSHALASLSEAAALTRSDCLVDNWLSVANYHYCALYSQEFRTQYDGWWTVRAGNPSPELTSLILRVCACSLLFIIDGSVKQRLESELRADSLTLATRLHEAAETLGASIPHGKGGLIHVQQLFLTAFWYKSAEKWTEAWHALSSAIGAAYEIGNSLCSSTASVMLTDIQKGFTKTPRLKACLSSTVK